MVDIDKLINECQAYKMLDDRLLVHPLELRSYSTTDTVLDDEANKGKNPMLDELQTKQETVTINYKYQLAIVVAKSDNIKDLEVGDKVVYKISNLIEFDLIPNVSMLKRFEVIAKIM